MLPMYAFLTTLILGPAMFYWLGKAIYQKRKLRIYPMYLVDGVGDTIFLPWFNAMIAGYGLDFVNPYVAISGALAITVGWLTYRLFWERTLDWSMPKHAHFSFGGWYHISFFFVQSFLILSGLMEHYNNFWVWLPLILYLVMAFFTLAFQVPKYKLTHKN